MSKLLFESQTCTRCNGTGTYSYNQRHGSVCYGCAGRGEQLTKRGAEAQRFFRELSLVRAADLKSGDVVRGQSITRGGDAFKHPSLITGIAAEGDQLVLNLKSKHGESFLFLSPEARVELISADRGARIERALAYQATLTKTGTVFVRKRA
jgi:hypothetical protein